MKRKPLLPAGGATFGPGSPGGIGKPVALDTSDYPYGTGVDSPQFIPGSPHNLPPNKDRPAFRQFMPAGGGLPSVPSAGAVDPLPMAPQQATVFDPFHYAKPIEGSAPTDVISALVLQEASTKRNYLLLRNSSTGGQVIFVAFGSDASNASALRLAPDEIAFLDPVPQSDMYVVSNVAGGRISWAVSTIAV